MELRINFQGMSFRFGIILRACVCVFVRACVCLVLLTAYAIMDSGSRCHRRGVWDIKIHPSL